MGPGSLRHDASTTYPGAFARSAAQAPARFRFPSVFAPARRFRQLPVQVAWKRHQIVLAQALVMVTVIGGWQIAAWLKLIDPFFWSQPTAIANTLTIFSCAAMR